MAGPTTTVTTASTRRGHDTRLHLGCGRSILPGWVNVDAVAGPGRRRRPRPRRVRRPTAPVRRRQRRRAPRQPPPRAPPPPAAVHAGAPPGRAAGRHRVVPRPVRLLRRRLRGPDPRPPVLRELVDLLRTTRILAGRLRIPRATGGSPASSSPSRAAATRASNRRRSSRRHAGPQRRHRDAGPAHGSEADPRTAPGTPGTARTPPSSCLMPANGAGPAEAVAFFREHLNHGAWRPIGIPEHGMLAIQPPWTGGVDRTRNRPGGLRE